MAQSMTKGQVPFYNRKFPKDKYLKRGDPYLVTEETVMGIEKWIVPTDEECNLWDDAKATVTQKDKKKDFYIEFPKDPTKNGENMYTMTITVLHTDYRGFTYIAKAETVDALNKRFWPIVLKLIAYYCSPKLKQPTV